MLKLKFSLGDTVRIIDRDEAPTEWAVFIISSIEKDCFLLTAPDGKNHYESFWVRDEQVTQSDLTMELKND
jgi:hypothetical protein